MCYLARMESNTTKTTFEALITLSHGVVEVFFSRFGMVEVIMYLHVYTSSIQFGADGPPLGSPPSRRLRRRPPPLNPSSHPPSLPPAAAATGSGGDGGAHPVVDGGQVRCPVAATHGGGGEHVAGTGRRGRRPAPEARRSGGRTPPI